MRVYFLSEVPCALVVDGAYFGSIDGFERSAQLNLEDGLFLEFLPTSPLAPLRFYLNEQTIFSPPKGLCVYHVKDAIALYAKDFAPLDCRMRILWQKKIDRNTVTLYRQGVLQLSVQNEGGFFLVDLPDTLYPCTVRPTHDGILLESDTAFALITNEGGMSVLSRGKILSAEQTLKAEVPLCDSLQSHAVVEWQDGKIISYTVRTERDAEEQLIPLALFECVLVGADPSPFLHQTLLPKAGALKEFLGTFTDVRLTDQTDVIGLVFPVRERVFEVRYFRTTLTDGKVSNVAPIR